MFKKMFLKASENAISEQYNLFPIKNKGKSFKAKESSTNEITDTIESKFGKIFSKKSTGLTPNGKFYQFDLKKGKEDRFEEVVKFLDDYLN